MCQAIIYNSTCFRFMETDIVNFIVLVKADMFHNITQAQTLCYSTAKKVTSNDLCDSCFFGGVILFGLVLSLLSSMNVHLCRIANYLSL